LLGLPISFNTTDFIKVSMYLIKFTIDISQSFDEFGYELMNFVDILDAM